MTTHFSPMPPKGALQSKGVLGSGLAVIGALITFFGALGWLPFGIAFNPDTGDLTINVYSAAGFATAAATGIGAPLAFIGRIFGTRAIRGLWRGHGG